MTGGRPGDDSVPGGVSDGRGSASIWVVSCIALLLVVAGVTSLRAAAVVLRHRVESAADLAALAGAAQIGVGVRLCAAAGSIARRDGTMLHRCRARLDPSGRSGTVSVVVERRVRLPLAGSVMITASARAGRLPPGRSPPIAGAVPP